MRTWQQSHHPSLGKSEQGCSQGLPAPGWSSVPTAMLRPPHRAGKDWGVPHVPPPWPHMFHTAPPPRLGVNQCRTGSNSRCWRNAINKAGGREEAAGGTPGPLTHRQMFPVLAGLSCACLQSVLGRKVAISAPRGAPAGKTPPSPCRREITLRFLHKPGQG